MDNSQANAFGDYGVFDPEIYGAVQETQAFGGAGQEVIKEEETLVVLANEPVFDVQAVQAVVEGQDTV
jgi:hypothetical protein